MMNKHLIVGIHVTERAQHAQQVQQIMTQYGCNIKTRIGLHDVDQSFCSPNGLILLEMFGDEKTCLQMADEINALEGIEVQKMLFDHP